MFGSAQTNIWPFLYCLSFSIQNECVVLIKHVGRIFLFIFIVEHISKMKVHFENEGTF